MGNTWVTDLRHFLNSDGSILQLPRPAARLANYFGSIEEAVTARKNSDTWLTGIRCCRRPGRRRCEGEIFAFIDKGNSSRIDWHCSVCDDNGIISGWQSTLWDRSGDT